MGCERLLLSRAPCRVSANTVPIIPQFRLCLLAWADSLNLQKEAPGEMHRVAETLPIHPARPLACFRLGCTSSYCIMSVPEAGCGSAMEVCFLNGGLAHYAHYMKSHYDLRVYVCARRWEGSLGHHSSDVIYIIFEIGCLVGLEETFLVSLPVAVIKYSGKHNLKETGFIVAHSSRAQRSVAERSRPQELQAPGYIPSVQEEERRAVGPWLSSLSLFTQFRISASEWCHP